MTNTFRAGGAGQGTEIEALIDGNNKHKFLSGIGNLFSAEFLRVDFADDLLGRGRI
jgi:hypothetical protein